MIRYSFIFTTIFLSLLVVCSSFLPHTNVAEPLVLGSAIDSLTATKGPGSMSCIRRTRLPSCCQLSSKNNGMGKEEAVNSNGMESVDSNISQNKTKTTKGYRPIEEWHEETQDRKHVIRQLKQEKARWKKTFRDLEK